MFDIEKLIRDSERLAIVKDYVMKKDYLDKDIMLALLGEKPITKVNAE